MNIVTPAGYGDKKQNSFNMKRIIVLGCGMVGSAIAADLSEKFDVTSADVDADKLSLLAKNHRIKTEVFDITKGDNLSSQLEGYNVVVNAMPGYMGFDTLKKVIGAGKDVVDISFFPEDAFELDTLAKEKDVTAVIDCGVAPGLSNILLGYHHKKDKVKTFTCYVGGLPVERLYPFQYKAPFSPSDVIEEYTRPARIKENNKIRIKPALSEPELLNFDGIGTLEAFNSDGLRTLLRTIDIPDMKEKTIRYPGHLDAIKLLRDSGFFSTDEILINNISIRPVDLSSRILFELWKLKEDDDEFTVMQVDMASEEDKFSYFLLDRKDNSTGFTSMARTTGFTCTAVVSLIAEEKLKNKGICPPELIGMNAEHFNYIMNYLNSRGVIVTKK
jgi:lysine 6-dehydrogenase